MDLAKRNTRFKNLKEQFEQLTYRIGRNNSAYILMLISQITYLCCMLFMKSSTHISPAYSQVIRGTVGIVITYVTINLTDQKMHIKSRRVSDYLLVRSLIIGLNQVIVYQVVQILDLSNTILIQNTGPIFIFLIDWLWYREPANGVEKGGCFLAFLGAYVMVKGHSLLFPGDNSRVSDYDSHFKELVVLLAIVIAWSWSIVMLKGIQKEVTPLQIYFYNCAAIVFTNSLQLCEVQGPNELALNELSYQDYAWMVFLLGFMLYVNGVTYFIAINIADSLLSVNLLQYSQLILSLLADFFYFGNPVDAVRIFGAVILISGVLMNLYFGKLKKVQASK